MRTTLALVFILLAAGCLGREGGTDPSTTEAQAPVKVYDKTLDFSTDPSGAPREEPLSMPAGARHFAFTVTWEGQPAGPTANVAISLLDGEGNTVASCDLGTSAVAGEGRDCGPQTNMADRGPYVLRWEGFGPVRGHVVVTATFPQE